MNKKYVIMFLSCLLLCGCHDKNDIDNELIEEFPNINIIYQDEEIVRVKNFIPNIKVDLRYASTNNFTEQVIYNFDEAYLRYGTVKKLINVQNELDKYEYKLLIWDAYRPHLAQYKLWEVYPDATYVSNPFAKYSSHSNGGTIDVSLVDSNNMELEMPSSFDEFSKLADRNYSEVSANASKNAMILQNIMESNGFSSYYNEWWHYSDTTNYEYEDIKNMELPDTYNDYLYISCEDNSMNIPVNSKVKLLGFKDNYIHIQYQSNHGYIEYNCVNTI